MNFSPYLRLMRVDKPIGTYLVLLPALAALWLAAGDVPPLSFVLIFTLGAFLMRSAGCVINDYADRHWDGEVGRTCDRPLVCGEVTPRQALHLFAGLLLLAGVLLLWLPSEVMPWAVGAVLLAVLYPFTKRWLYYPQLFLGLAFAWAVPMAFVSILGTMPVAGWWLFALTVLWALIYDSWYALVDREDDLRVGIKSTAVWFGDRFFAIMLLLMLLFVWLVYALGQAFDLGMVWWFVCAAIALDFAWQWWRVYHDHTLAFWAFRHNVWIGVVLWVGIWVSLSLR